MVPEDILRALALNQVPHTLVAEEVASGVMHWILQAMPGRGAIGAGVVTV